MLGSTACRRERLLLLPGAAGVSPAARVFSRTRAHVYQPSAVSQDLSNGKPSAPGAAARGVAREGGAGFGASTREAPVAVGTVCTLCRNWSALPLLLGAGGWVSTAFRQALGRLPSVPKEG